MNKPIRKKMYVSDRLYDFFLEICEKTGTKKSQFIVDGIVRYMSEHKPKISDVFSPVDYMPRGNKDNFSCIYYYLPTDLIEYIDDYTVERGAMFHTVALCGLLVNIKRFLKCCSWKNLDEKKFLELADGYHCQPSKDWKRTLKRKLTWGDI